MMTARTAANFTQELLQDFVTLIGDLLDSDDIDEAQARELDGYHTFLLTHLANNTLPPPEKFLAISSFIAEINGS